MYKPAHNKNGSLAHSQECQMAFGRKDPLCPRCQELMSGSPSRSWAGSNRKAEDAARAMAIRSHYSTGECQRTCGVVCVRFDY